MKPWEIWQCPFRWGPHPAVVISNERRVSLKPQIVVLSCQTMRPQTYRDPEALEALLDQEDGLSWKTLCRCDLFWTVDKSSLTVRIGEVRMERRRDIARKIVAALAIAGL